jgi:hypothetical protein
MTRQNDVVTTLRIIVPEDLVMDGTIDIPQVGDHVDYALQFYLAEPWIHPETSNDVVALVEPLSEGRLSAAWTDPYGRVHPGTYSLRLGAGGPHAARRAGMGKPDGSSAGRPVDPRGRHPGGPGSSNVAIADAF